MDIAECCLRYCIRQQYLGISATCDRLHIFSITACATALSSRPVVGACVNQRVNQQTHTHIHPVPAAKGLRQKRVTLLQLLRVLVLAGLEDAECCGIWSTRQRPDPRLGV